MNRKLSILFLFAAMIAFVAHGFIPHHEHGETICFEHIHGDEQDSQNDADNINPCCLNKQEIVRNQNESIRLNLCACDFHYPPVLLFQGNFFVFETQQDKTFRKPYPDLLYTSADCISAASLRGPPQNWNFFQ